jgi:hypothetical protein
MGPEPERVHFLGALVVDPHLDGVLGEHVAPIGEMGYTRMGRTTTGIPLL